MKALAAFSYGQFFVVLHLLLIRGWLYIEPINLLAFIVLGPLLLFVVTFGRLVRCIDEEE